MASQACSFTGNALHSTTIAKNAEGMVGNEIKPISVEDGSRVSLSNGKANGIAKTLAKRTSGDLDTGSIMGFRMTRSNAADLAKVFQIVHGQLVAKEMQQSILKHASMAVSDCGVGSNSSRRVADLRQNEAITIDPVGILGIEGHEFIEEHMGDGSKTHRSSRMTRVGFESGIRLPPRSVVAQGQLGY
jgi:hypothetical protein